MNYELNFGRSGYRRRAFRYIFARLIFVSHSKSDLGTSTSSVTSSPSPKLLPESLAKDAAPIPNALEATNTKSRALIQIYILSQRRKETQRNYKSLCDTLRLCESTVPKSTVSSTPATTNAWSFSL